MKSPRFNLLKYFFTTIVLIGYIFSTAEAIGQSSSSPPICFWQLTTGSKIAYQKIECSHKEPIPIFFLHGGPGANILPIDSIGYLWLKHLTTFGYEIYLYDQIGSGYSARLSDPFEYSVERHVNDFEQIRILTGNKKVVIIGDSWGATLAVKYLEKYNENVLKIVLTSPGPIDPHKYWGIMPPALEDMDFEYIKMKEGKKGVEKFQKLQKLLSTDIRASYKFIGDSLMDTMYNEILNKYISSKVVYDQNVKPIFNGMGWWASKMTIYDVSLPRESTKNKIKGLTLPVLIIRGEHDYLSEQIALEYKSVFPNSIYKKISRAGHIIWKDKPDEIAAAIEWFLKNS